ncbi:hypothetical protein L916_05033 [Phytophthora nicotianae]|uniref:Uncharacterized protein n=1 Tax=Phytophthora nicotianae TaxID=4792 RepID=W2JGK8_PHYNI|nr:hypothetical protein L916_05033 [Phytophthora nicotianae]
MKPGGNDLAERQEEVSTPQEAQELHEDLEELKIIRDSVLEPLYA